MVICREHSCTEDTNYKLTSRDSIYKNKTKLQSRRMMSLNNSCVNKLSWPSMRNDPSKKESNHSRTWWVTFPHPNQLTCNPWNLKHLSPDTAVCQESRLECFWPQFLQCTVIDSKESQNASEQLKDWLDKFRQQFMNFFIQNRLTKDCTSHAANCHQTNTEKWWCQQVASTTWHIFLPIMRCIMYTYFNQG